MQPHFRSPPLHFRASSSSNLLPPLGLPSCGCHPPVRKQRSRFGPSDGGTSALRVEGHLGARVWGSAGSGRRQGPRASVGMAVCGEGVGRAGRRRGGRPTATVRSCTISGGTRAGLAVLPLGSARPWGPAPNPDGAASALRVQRHPHPLSSDSATANELSL